MARELGYTRRELLQRVTSLELTEWAAFYYLEREQPEGQTAEQQKDILRAFGGKRS